MPRNGETSFEPNQKWFDQILRSNGVERIVDAAAEDTLATAKATAPEDTGAYKAGLHIEHEDGRYRRTARVVGDDPKTMLIEARTGNLARSVKAARKR
ncbi:HK97 gp10 family phage protein [Microbacterium oryzae]|uniref:HK97 gp10 family phage protein n=1 Tax=Microbacterium oryzae TaxID=743009 RepID=UPI0025AF1B91|nr:HK97 gp10 family phage protein [Microbacterium oryzae]MDN3309563.1 HK97 gp10 family phage protein [Microbacterium oryzae]